MFETNLFDLAPKAAPGAVIQGPQYRFTVLTDRMIRMEWDENGVFEDRPTKTVFRRHFPVPHFEVRETAESLEIITGKLHLYYNKRRFTQGGLSVALHGMIKHKCAKWHYKMPEITIHNSRINLHGTVSTLDSIDGPCELDDGLLDRHGFTVIDDSAAMVLDENGWFVPARRPEDSIDIYFLGYLEDHKDCIRDFYRLSGAAPMLPRYALGNWWSRYYKYTEESYEALMDKFSQKQIPLSVSVLDIDWHITQPDPKYGNGWTGHTWNRKFFPDPRRFLDRLHERGLKVTLNLHPCDGIRAFEESYERAARAMGIDPSTEEPVQFDASDPRFMKTYLEEVLHPLEDEGVDFWWIDWQQKGGFSQDGYDPLWMLNHYLYTDNARKGTYPLTLSRYAGLGSHRYPLGFSGDTVMSWNSLDFQPFFTNCASNVGYGWWSHDIGGHTRGVWDDELQVRWVQYGVFSPIFRLHSASSTFMLKEPWNFPIHMEEIISDFMRLRHQLIPYLYTMTYRCHAEGLPLICPLYYDYPREMTNDKEFLNEYTFGSSLLVCPITTPMDKRSQTGRVFAWIPKGTWFDIFTCRRYTGAKRLALYRPLRQYPVLARAGTILPLAADGPAVNGAPLPEKLLVRVFCGADGTFRLYEDDERLANAQKAFTSFAFRWGEISELHLAPVEGAAHILPRSRDYCFSFTGSCRPEKMILIRNGAASPMEYTYCDKTHTASAAVPAVNPFEELTIRMYTNGRLAENDYRREIEARLPRYQIENVTKQALLDAVLEADSRLALAGSISAICGDPYITGELLEILTSAQ